MPFFILTAAMAAIILASNVLVQFPLSGSLGRYALGDILTWGAFTYPLAFLITDLANRGYGPRMARRVVFGGFIIAILASLIVPPLLYTFGLIGFETSAGRLQRIAIASGLAFLCGQLLDVTLFNRLRAGSWWKAPMVGSLFGSLVDTALFFTLAFSAVFMVLGPIDEFAAEYVPLLGIYTAEYPRWVSWAIGDFIAKVLIAAIALVPYRLLMDTLGNWQTTQSASAKAKI
jgi:queuosine precursor transporter